MPCTIGLATVWRTAGTMRVRCYAAANWMPSDVAAALRGFCVPGQNHSKQKHDGPDASGNYFVHMNLPYAEHSRQSEKRFTLAQSPIVLLRSELAFRFKELMSLDRNVHGLAVTAASPPCKPSRLF